MYQKFYARFIQPRSAKEDSRRQEVIFNVLIVGALALAIVALIASTLSRVVAGHVADSNAPIVPLAFVLSLLGLGYLSRRGYYFIGTYALVAFFAAIGTLGILQWSFEIPEGELIYALAIVMAGILVGSAGLLVATGVISLGVIVVGYLQAHHQLHPNTAWLAHPVIFNDAVVYAVTFWVIALIMRLAIREIGQSLRRARASEADLAAERDNLEVKVVERTQALEQSQRERVLELERFAEFGRVSAGLLHDLANPLTTASLNLAELDAGRHSRAAKQALQSVQYLERYVAAARKQLQHESTLKTFSVNSELNQVVKILEHKARTEGVSLKLAGTGNCRLYGDSVKFHQLAANLIANAIEAYAGQRADPKSVEIKVRRTGKQVVLAIRDSGVGISDADLAHVFTPFYSTKRADNRSTGLGLSLVQRIVQRDFKGDISVTSSPAAGTEFTVVLRDHPKDNAA